MADDVVKKSIKKALQKNYEITVKPNSWVLPNRAKFSNWIDTIFKYKGTRYTKCTECEEGESCPMKVKLSSVSLFPHQEFIKDYMQFASPYRGLLVYHGLGSGKSCSSIVAAEILMGDTDVTVMLPASLRNNYINEVKKCGCNFYNTAQHWVFLEKPDMIKYVQENVKISASVIKKNKGVWVPLDGHKPNYKELSETARNQIDDEVKDIIENRFNIVNYNGLTRKNIEKWTENGVNPFDNKTIIVDEIHNLISRIVNGRKIGSALYKLLMSAKQCKLILLSGTPIINYPYEVAYILNLIAGPMKYFELKANTKSEFVKDTIESVLIANKYVDDFNIDIGTRQVTIYLLPLGFHMANRKQSKVARYAGEPVKYETIITDIINELKTLKHDFNKKYATKETTLFPEKREEFDSLFVDEEMGTIRNQRLFMKRTLGTVSFYNTFSPELFPSWSIEEVPAFMTTSQFNVYEKSRAEERKKDNNSKKFKKGGKEGLFDNSGQVYRFFSRAICNFVFPEHIKRPFPSKLSDMKNEIDDEEDVINIIDKNKEEESKSKKKEEYQSKLRECLKAMEEGKETYLSRSEIGKYSPKFQHVLERILDSPGNTLVYSQFRTVEGLGLLGMTLRANGWAEFKIKKEGGDWDIDMTADDLKKPTYAAFTGNNEESRILMKIFNNEYDGLPPRILNAIKDRDNLYGGVMKVLMITQSGAEGISLKNTRQVHIIEPYWNHIRLDQVIGRAVRTCSHVALPPKDRNVKVFIYYSKFTEEQKASSFTIRTLDKSVTSDEYLFNIAKKKKLITDGLLEILQKASVDCALNAKHHGIKCFAFPVNIDANKLTIGHDIHLEESNASYTKGIEKKPWQGQLLRTKKGNFVIKEGTDEVYDYDIYLESGKVVKIGTISHDGNKRIIKFADE